MAYRHFIKLCTDTCWRAAPSQANPARGVRRLGREAPVCPTASWQVGHPVCRRERAGPRPRSCSGSHRASWGRSSSRSAEQIVHVEELITEWVIIITYKVTDFSQSLLLMNCCEVLLLIVAPFSCSLSKVTSASRKRRGHLLCRALLVCQWLLHRFWGDFSEWESRTG